MFLYELPISLYSFKVRLALGLKKLDLELREPPGGTYRSAEFRAINPAGTIPTLVDGDHWLCESDAIIEYLDDLGLGAPLRSANHARRARDRMLSRWVDLRLEASVRFLFPHVAPAGRDATVVRDADARISAALALFENSFDAVGPFASGSDPGLADCGLTATLVWLETLSAPLALGAAQGGRVVRVRRAMETDARCACQIADYKKLVAEWTSSRLG